MAELMNQTNQMVNILQNASQTGGPVQTTVYEDEPEMAFLNLEDESIQPYNEEEFLDISDDTLNSFQNTGEDLITPEQQMANEESVKNLQEGIMNFISDPEQMGDLAKDVILGINPITDAINTYPDMVEFYKDFQDSMNSNDALGMSISGGLLALTIGAILLPVPGGLAKNLKHLRDTSDNIKTLKKAADAGNTDALKELQNINNAIKTQNQTNIGFKQLNPEQQLTTLSKRLNAIDEEIELAQKYGDEGEVKMLEKLRDRFERMSNDISTRTNTQLPAEDVIQQTSGKGDELGMFTPESTPSPILSNEDALVAQDITKREELKNILGSQTDSKIFTYEGDIDNNVKEELVKIADEDAGYLPNNPKAQQFVNDYVEEVREATENFSKLPEKYSTPDTINHIEDLGFITDTMNKYLKIPNLTESAIRHDIGKSLIPSSLLDAELDPILSKNSKVAQIINPLHDKLGEEILKNNLSLKKNADEINAAVKYHHKKLPKVETTEEQAATAMKFLDFFQLKLRPRQYMTKDIEKFQGKDFNFGNHYDEVVNNLLSDRDVTVENKQFVENMVKTLQKPDVKEAMVKYFERVNK